MPLSGSAAGYPGDVAAELPKLGAILLEVKARKASPLYAWLDGRDAVVIKADRREPLIVLRLEDLLKMIDEQNRDGVSSLE